MPYFPMTLIHSPSEFRMFQGDALAIQDMPEKQDTQEFRRVLECRVGQLGAGNGWNRG